jgi:hypothetical protein
MVSVSRFQMIDLQLFNDAVLTMKERGVWRLIRWEDGPQWRVGTYKKEEIVAYLNVLPWHLPRETEENNSSILKGLKCYSPTMIYN